MLLPLDVERYFFLTVSVLKDGHTVVANLWLKVRAAVIDVFIS